MQLVPVLMALRDAVGLERVVVDTYQSVSAAPARKAIARARGPDPGARRRRAARGQRLSAPDRLQRAARDRRLPRQRLHQGGVEGRHREPQDPAPARPADLVHGRPRAGLRGPLRGGPRRDRASRSRPDRARELFAAVPGVDRPGRPGRARLPAGDRGRRSRRDLRRPRPPGRVDRRTTAASRSGSCRDNLRKGAATNAVQLAEVLVERGWIRGRRARARPYARRERRRGPA